jgi:hypothetical protein
MAYHPASTLSAVSFLLCTVGRAIFFGHHAWLGLSGRKVITPLAYRGGWIVRISGFVGLLVIVYLVLSTRNILTHFSEISIQALAEAIQ